MIFKKVTDLLKEEKATYEYGCAMLYFSFDKLKELQSKISEDDLYTGSDDENSRYGLEDEPHVTLLYGLHSEVTDDDVFNTVFDFKDNINDLELINVSKFDNPKYDVLKFDVKSQILKDINKALTKLPHTTDFPDYHAHSTIAYLKKGMSNKYIELFKDNSYKVKPLKIVYSKADGTKLEKSI